MGQHDCFIGWLTVAIALVGLTALVGFLLKMRNGFGAYNTSALLILVALIFTALLGIHSKLDGDAAKLFFAVIGFAGGFFVGRNASNRRRDRPAEEQRQMQPPGI